MVAAGFQCNHDRLRQLLSDELSPNALEETTRHLDSCQHCRTELESIAADATWWSQASELLGDDEEISPGPARLDFLEPSDNPAMLGRLGDYEIIELIGQGGMAIVLKGYDRELNRYVAIKVLSPHLAHSGAGRRRFAREAQAAAAVVHQHVVAIHTVNGGGQLPYLVMPYVQGESLQQRLDREGPLQLCEILRIGMQAAEGLAAAHAQGLVHRDVKPSNILLEKGVDRVLLTDFGLARAVDDATLTRSCVIAGTPQYMAPEQSKGESVDHRSDLFSLGSVLYAMCTGHPPFRAENTMAILRRICEADPRPVRQVNSEIPAWFEPILLKLLAKNPGDRFTTAQEVADILAQHLAHVQHPTSIPLPPPIVITANKPVTRSSSTRLWQITAIAGSAALLIGIGFGAAKWAGGPPTEKAADRAAGLVTQAPKNPIQAGNAGSGEINPAATMERATWSDPADIEIEIISETLWKLELENRFHE